MREFSHQSEERKEDIEELLQRYENLKNGQSASYLEEEEFERIINYFESREAFKKALQATETAIEQFPYSAGLLIKKADLVLNNRAYDIALELLDKASIFDGNNIDIYILKTEALLALDRQEEAVVLLEEALNLFEGDEKIELLFELADVYDDYESFDKVFDCLKWILELEPANEEALYKICFWTDYTGRNAESIELHQKIINEFPYSELAWFNLGAAYQGIKLYEKAIDAYKYAIVIDEKFDYAYRNIGDAYIRLRKYKDAIEYLERVLELAKPEDVIYEAIGYCYEKLKNYAQARFYFRKASHLNDDKGALLYKIALTYYKEDKFELCIRQLEAALKIKNNHPEYLLLMGQSKLALGLDKEALQYFLNVVRLRPKQLMGWEALIIGLYKAEQFEQGLDQVQQAILKIGADKPLFHYYKALFYFGLGRSKQALIELEEGLRKAPRQLKKIVEVEPGLLQRPSVAALIAQVKRKR
ncbi:tetratricopeptide repeat protein [Niabella pedocola]|uniref:Tetratricopeptide repeat protein n=1 Tax=Niabella pedocola TaxID=1752077 RepID=A0ABS8PQK0_9BACT|nr:tetratricopeptide repeat protein [Niabella pedocola]MCD2423354.1 tetratricopeptide repeat protein [Niabella pedocola]